MLGFLLARTGRLASLIVFVVGCALWTRGVESTNSPTAFPQASNLTQLLELAPTMQDTLLPVHLEGVACWVAPDRGLVALQENSRLAFLDLGLSNGTVRAGNNLVIDGDCMVQRGRFNLSRAPVVNNDGVHGIVEKSGKVFLRAGKHLLQVSWFNHGGPSALEVEYEGPNVPRQSIPNTALFRAVPDPAHNTTNWEPGLAYRAYEGSWENLPDFDQLKPARQGKVPGFDLNVRTRTDDVGLEFTGYLEVTQDGLYTFYTQSDDGSRLSLDAHPTRVLVRPTHELPPPRQIFPGQRFLPEERQWCEAEGKATFLQETPNFLIVELSSPQGQMTALLPPPSHFAPSLLSDARLRLRGVCQGLYKNDGQSIAGRMLVPNPEAVTVLSVPPQRWTAFPISPIPGNRVDSADVDTKTIIHLRGKVQTVTTPRNFTLEDAAGSVAVESLQPLTVGAGTAVEVQGRWCQTGTNVVLASALWREPVDAADHDSGKSTSLTTVEQVHSLKREEAQRQYPVHIRGVVTYARSKTADGVIQDSTRGIYVQNLAPQGFIPLQVGDYLEVEGETSPGDFAPIISAHRVTPLGRGQLPPPMHPTWDQITGGSAECQYVELDGIITSARDGSLNFLMREGHLQVSPPDDEFPILARYEDAHVRLRGCLLNEWDPKTRRVTIGAIQLRAVSVHVEQAAPRDLFAVPAKQIDEVDQFDVHASALERVRVRGQMLHRRDGEYYLTDGTNGLRFLPKMPDGLQLGDQVEVAGFPELGGPSPVLRESVVRKIGPASPLVPRRLEPETLLAGTNDATLVEVDGDLVRFRSTPTEQVLELQSGPRTFFARLGTNAGVMKPISIRSRLRLQGVYAAGDRSRPNGPGNSSFELLLNRPGDVRILAQPSWWTPRHLLAVVSIMAGVLLLAATWIRALRQRVDRKTEALRAEILERKRAEEELRRQREWLRVTLNSIGDAVIACDTDQRVTFLNPIAASLTGWQPQDAVGQPMHAVFKIVNQHSPQPPQDIVSRVLNEGIILSLTDHTCAVAKNGHNTPVEQSAAPILGSDGQIAGVVVIFRDVTLHQHLEAQLRQAQKMESVGQLAAGIAHDFNNVLTVIDGHTELLLADKRPPGDIESLCEISKAAKRCANLTRQLLAFSRQQIMRQEVIDMNLVIDNVSGMLRRVLGENIHLRVRRATAPVLACADPGMIEQVLLNLAVNSRDAMPKGGDLAISISLTTIEESQSHRHTEAYAGRFVHLVVQDTGCGIPPENLTLVFEPFFTTKDVGRGTGLGLATVYGIVKQHQGWIELTSIVRKGTTFEIYLPACPA